MAETPTPPGAPRTTITDEDWRARELDQTSYESVAFAHLDLIDWVDEGMVFADCVFRDCRFNVSRHEDAAFVNCMFTRCSFFDARFVRCKLVGSRFSDCDLALLEADLRGATAAGARLRDVDLTAAWVGGADFRGADLRGSVLAWAAGEQPRLDGAVITADQAVLLAIGQGLVVRP